MPLATLDHLTMFGVVTFAVCVECSVARLARQRHMVTARFKTMVHVYDNKFRAHTATYVAVGDDCYVVANNAAVVQTMFC